MGFIDNIFYENAPLTEVAISVQFQDKLRFQSAHVGAFWDAVKTTHPVCQDQPPLGPIDEVFGANQLASVGFAFGVGHPGTRYWFISEDGSSLIQLQRNRLALNWRKISPGSHYVRYTALRARFAELVRETNSFFATIGDGPIASNVCECTYVNQVFFDKNQDFSDGLKSWISFHVSNAKNLEAEAASISVRYLVKGRSDQPRGRLYIKIDPIVGLDGRNGINLELTCRIVVASVNSEPELSALDLAHDQIVTTFDDITSDSAKSFWRGTNAT